MANKPPQGREHIISFWSSNTEKEAYDMVAKQLLLSRSTWIRKVLRDEAGRILRKLGMDVPFDPGNLDSLLNEDKKK